MFNNVLQFVRLGPDDGAVIQTTKDRDFPTGTAQSPQLPKSREQFIDVTRGLLLLLMINSHALFLAGVPKSNFLHSLLWLPQGWATQCFVILSGFAIGYIYSNIHRKLADSRHRLFQRGKEILIVMFISNVIFLAINYFMKGNISPLSSLDWWQGLFTFHTPYTIQRF